MQYNQIVFARNRFLRKGLCVKRKKILMWLLVSLVTTGVWASDDAQLTFDRARIELFTTAVTQPHSLCGITIPAPDVMTYHGQGWQFSSTEADLSLGSGSSNFSGDLSLLVSNSMITSQQAEVLRDDKRQTEKIVLQDAVTWLHPSWRLLVDELFYYPATHVLKAQDVRFMLFTKSQGRPWGSARGAVSDDPHRLILEDAVVTTCAPNNQVWSVRGKRMQWEEQYRKLVVEGARLYWYKTRMLYLGSVTFVDGEQTKGWLMPRAAFFDGDGIQIGRPYRFAYWPRTYDLMPFVSTRGGYGLQFNYQQHPQGEEQLGVIKVMQRGYLSPHDRAVGFYSGERTMMRDARLKWQFLQASDGFFAQQIARDIGVEYFRPNQDLTSFLSWDQSVGSRAHGVVAVQTQQRFSGEKWSVDLYSLPHFDVLPVVWMSNQYRGTGWQYQWQADNLRLLSPASYDYPEAQRFLGYVGYQKDRESFWRWQIGAWLKSRHIENDSIFDVDTNRTFVVPNVDLVKTVWYSTNKQFDLSYHYTAYVAQDSEPLFTTKHWYWRDQSYPNYLISMDRIFDRHAIKTHWRDRQLMDRVGLSLDWYHTFSLEDRRVTVTPSGDEDPVVRYPYGVSSFLVGDVQTGLDLALLVVWPEQSIQAFSLRLPLRSAQLYWQQGPGEVVWDNNTYSMPFTRKIGVVLPFSLGLRWLNTIEAAYQNSLDATMYLKNTLHYTGCCWEGSLYVTQNKLLSVYDENAASPQDNLMLGLQVTLRGL